MGNLRLRSASRNLNLCNARLYCSVQAHSCVSTCIFLHALRRQRRHYRREAQSRARGTRSPQQNRATTTSCSSTSTRRRSSSAAIRTRSRRSTPTSWRARGIRVVRRVSGGGAVYHDLGNLNFSFMTRDVNARFNRYDLFNKPVVEVLRELGVPAEIGGRNDILAGGRKISGNAQFATAGRMFSHGTLLLDSNLDDVTAALRPKPGKVESKGVKSMRSRVANISEFLREPNHGRRAARADPRAHLRHARPRAHPIARPRRFRLARRARAARAPLRQLGLEFRRESAEQRAARAALPRRRDRRAARRARRSHHRRPLLW